MVENALKLSAQSTVDATPPGGIPPAFARSVNWPFPERVALTVKSYKHFLLKVYVLKIFY
jgi:hypothetical protein